MKYTQYNLLIANLYIIASFFGKDSLQTVFLIFLGIVWTISGLLSWRLER